MNSHEIDVQEAQQCVSDLCEVLNRNGINYDLYPVDGVTRLIDERDELKEDRDELVAACKAMVKMLHGTTASRRLEVDAARAAIAKATGTEP